MTHGRAGVAAACDARRRREVVAEGDELADAGVDGGDVRRVAEGLERAPVGVVDERAEEPASHALVVVRGVGREPQVEALRRRGHLQAAHHGAHVVEEHLQRLLALRVEALSHGRRMSTRQTNAEIAEFPGEVARRGGGIGVAGVAEGWRRGGGGGGPRHAGVKRDR
jgi:hypothetical protein